MHLKFNETSGVTAADASGNNNIGTLANTASFAIGKNGNAVSLNGVNQYLSVNNSATLNPTTAITLSAWIKSSDLSGNRVIFQKQHYNPAFELAVYGGQLVFNLAGPGSASVAAPSTGAWHLVTATYDGTNKKIYINGALVATVAGTGVIGTNPESVFIGTRGSWENFFNGLIDDARIYNRALTATDVLALYNGGAGVPLKPNSGQNGTVLNSSTVASMSIYPNPVSASSEATIELKGFSSDENIQVTIFNLEGKIIYSTQTANTNLFQIDTQLFAKGLYVVTLQGQTQTLKEKLVIE
jgi:hypothetical protein